MTNKYMYFVANWKMYGALSSLNTLNKVIKFSKSKDINKGRLIYCTPYTLISSFSKKFKNCQIGMVVKIATKVKIMDLTQDLLMLIC